MVQHMNKIPGRKQFWLHTGSNDPVYFDKQRDGILRARQVVKEHNTWAILYDTSDRYHVVFRSD